MEAAEAERELIGSGRKRSGEIPWRKILSHSNLWILAVMYFCYNFNLNVYNDWFPTYLHDSRGMTLAKMGLYASLPLFAGTLGDLLGGGAVLVRSDVILAPTAGAEAGASADRQESRSPTPPAPPNPEPFPMSPPERSPA